MMQHVTVFWESIDGYPSRTSEERCRVGVWPPFLKQERSKKREVVFEG